MCDQDVQVLDIDYMERQRDFTYDPVNWADLPELVQELHNDNVKLTIILVIVKYASFLSLNTTKFHFAIDKHDLLLSQNITKKQT